MTTPLRITYREAVKQGIREALLADPRVFLMGEDVGKYGGCFAVSKGLLDESSEHRIFEGAPPVREIRGVRTRLRCRRLVAGGHA